MVGICVLVVLSTVPIAAKLGVNLVPRDDQSEFQVSFITPEGYTLERTDQVITEIEERLAGLPGVVHRFTVIGENNGTRRQGPGRRHARLDLLPHQGPGRTALYASST